LLKNFSVLFFISAVVFSQNLIKNAGFEDYIECPNTLGTFSKNVKSWSSPTSGTTDYFNLLKIQILQSKILE